jgi:hypothetical protein
MEGIDLITLLHIHEVVLYINTHHSSCGPTDTELKLKMLSKGEQLSLQEREFTHNHDIAA